jgi:excisionase family DNA binding protein
MKNITFDQLPQAVSELFGKLETIEQLLKAGNTSPAQDTNDLLTIEQACDFLHLSKPTVYLKVSKSEIPVCKLPGSRRLWFSKTELTDWIKTGRKATANEIKAQVAQSLTNKNKKK